MRAWTGLVMLGLLAACKPADKPPADDTAVPYPAISSGLTAADWNRAGYANNRVELRARPAP